MGEPIHPDRPITALSERAVQCAEELIAILSEHIVDEESLLSVADECLDVETVVSIGIVGDDELAAGRASVAALKTALLIELSRGRR